MYAIRVNYRTGDSFNTWDESETLELKWKNVKIAKENLQRIKEHYEWCDSHRPRSIIKKPKLDKPEWLKNKPEQKYHQFLLWLLNDKKEEVQCNVNWTGYFETLKGAQIIADPEDGWSFEL